MRRLSQVCFTPWRLGFILLPALSRALPGARMVNPGKNCYAYLDLRNPDPGHTKRHAEKGKQKTENCL